MLEKLRTSYLQPAELIETFSKYMVATEETGINEPFVATMMELLRGDIANLDGAIARLKTNKLIDATAKADDDRYDLLIGFRNQVLIGKRRNKPDMESASERVYEVITNVGLRRYRYGYSETSGKLKSLFRELDQPAFQEDLELLKAAEIYADLKAAESEFLGIYELRAKEEVAAADLRLNELRSKVVSRGTTFLNVVETLEVVEPEVFVTLARKFNFITTKIMAVARARRTRAENEESEGDSNGQTDDVENPFSDDVEQETSTVLA
ncbi:MAG: DUF6261 family protein [Cyclobacteriaceae bacterium]